MNNTIIIVKDIDTYEITYEDKRNMLSKYNKNDNLLFNLKNSPFTNLNSWSSLSLAHFKTLLSLHFEVLKDNDKDFEIANNSIKLVLTAFVVSLETKIETSIESIHITILDNKNIKILITGIMNELKLSDYKIKPKLKLVVDNTI